MAARRSLLHCTARGQSGATCQPCYICLDAEERHEDEVDVTEDLDPVGVALQRVLVSGAMVSTAVVSGAMVSGAIVSSKREGEPPPPPCRCSWLGSP